MKVAVALFLAVIVIIIGILLFGGDRDQRRMPEVTPTDSMKKGTLQISSPEFRNNEVIPARYTCDGDDISPPLSIVGVPAKAKTLVLIVDDPDAPSGTFDHLVVFNIPAPDKSLESISPGAFGEKLPWGSLGDNGARYGRNSWGRLGYGGPCPPSGTHRYFFKIYALDGALSLPVGVGKKEIERMMSGHILEEASLVGLYKRS